MNKNNIFKGDYSFDSTGNILTINSGGLQYYANQNNQFIISTIHYGTTYYQIINIYVDQNINLIPLPLIE